MKINKQKTRLFGIYLFFLFGLFMVISNAQAQQTTNATEELINLLIQKQTISQNDADSLRAELAVKQQEVIKDKTFKMDLELKPRTEYRNGFKQLRTASSSPAFFTNQRTRVSFNYQHDNKLIIQASLQDVRVWGRDDPRSVSGTVQVFEAYAEPFITPKFSIRIGRQKLVYDNQRLFAENDWRVNAGSHDAVTLRYNSEQFSTDLAVAFNQNSEQTFGTNYNSSAFTQSNYKTLIVNYLKYKLNDNWAFTSINAVDGYQDPNDAEKTFRRVTDGGRVEFEKGNLYLTFSGYYQSGKNSVGKALDAWYIQPEIKYTIPQQFVVRLGAEVFSGDNNSKKDSYDHNFVGLYGVAHRFNGNMEYFTQLPTNAGSAGLVNPYLFFVKNIGKKVELRSDFHLFYSQNNYVSNGATINKYLGYENDLGVVYKPNSYTKVDVGFSYIIADQSLAIIQNKGGDNTLTPTWAYVSVTFKPQLFKANFK